MLEACFLHSCTDLMMKSHLCLGGEQHRRLHAADPCIAWHGKARLKAEAHRRAPPQAIPMGETWLHEGAWHWRHAGWSPLRCCISQ